MVTMPKGKSPGNDGRTVEFYQLFWYYIKDFCINSINCSQIKKDFSVPKRQAIIKLIEKKVRTKGI